MKNKKIKTKKIESVSNKTHYEEMKDMPFLLRIMKIREGIFAPKKQQSKMVRYSYRTLQDIYPAIKDLCLEYAVYINISDEIIDLGTSTSFAVYNSELVQNLQERRVYIKSKVTLKDVFGTKEEVVSIGYAREVTLSKSMDLSQSTGSATTYARKSALDAMFLMDNEQPKANVEYGSADPDGKIHDVANNVTSKQYTKPMSRPVSGGDLKDKEEEYKKLQEEVKSNIDICLKNNDFNTEGALEYYNVKTVQELWSLPHNSLLSLNNSLKRKIEKKIEVHNAKE